jgi:hypothetical protein
MSYQPIIPYGGNLGWSFLKNTRDAQQETFDSSAAITTNAEYFREHIGKIQSAEELVSDRRLLTVALGAFGLDDDIENRFYIQKVLEEGTLNEESFANRLADKRYFAMAEAFGFELVPPSTAISTFPDEILDAYKKRQFEVAVGDQDSDLRLALGIERDLTNLADSDLSEEAAWFTIMGTSTMRSVFETALGLPSEIAAVDIDQQLKIFKEKSSSLFGTTDPSDFADPELQDELVRNFLFRAELEASSSATSQGSVALTLLQSQTPLF